MSEILNIETIAKGRFLELQNILFKNDDGKIIKWEACQRKNTNKVVGIITILKPSNQLVLVKEFRAPVGKYCIGHPAGLIEPNEDIEQSILRELKEETGYVGNIKYISPFGENSAGLTGELSCTAVVFVDQNAPENKNPIQHLDNDEHIEIIKVPINDLGLFINEQTKLGNICSSKLHHFLIGIQLQLESL